MVFGEKKKVIVNNYIDARFQTNKGIMVLNLVLCKWWNSELEMFNARTVAYFTTIAKYTTAFEVALEIAWIRKLVSELCVVCNVFSPIDPYCRKLTYCPSTGCIGTTIISSMYFGMDTSFELNGEVM